MTCHFEFYLERIGDEFIRGIEHDFVDKCCDGEIIPLGLKIYHGDSVTTDPAEYESNNCISFKTRDGEIYVMNKRTGNMVHYKFYPFSVSIKRESIEVDVNEQD